MYLKKCICGNEDIKKEYRINDNLVYGKCSKCNTLRQLNKIDINSINSQYKSELSVRNALPFEKSLEKTCIELWKRLDFYYWNITSNPKEKHLLDVGCSCGVFLNHVKKVGLNWKLYGIDIIKESTQIAKEKFNLKNIFYKDLLKSDFLDEYFDLITFHEVIEHLTNPIKYLRKAYLLLKKGGIIQITTPFFDNTINWKNWEMMRKDHLWILDVFYLEKILTKIGFTINIIEDFSESSYQNCIMLLGVK